MLTNQTQDYEFNLDDQASIVELITKALANPTFKSCSVYLGQNWPAFQSKPDKIFKVQIGLEFKEDATNN
jgi:hypothetical protein